MESTKSLIKEQRNFLLHVRIKGSVFNLLSDMIERRQKVSKKKISQADIIEEALRFADGQIPELQNQKIQTSKNSLEKGKKLIKDSQQLLIK